MRASLSLSFRMADAPAYGFPALVPLYIASACVEMTLAFVSVGSNRAKLRHTAGHRPKFDHLLAVCQKTAMREAICIHLGQACCQLYSGAGGLEGVAGSDACKVTLL